MISNDAEKFFMLILIYGILTRELLVMILNNSGIYKEQRLSIFYNYNIKLDTVMYLMYYYLRV